MSQKRRRKQYDDDDGRTIADMSSVSGGSHLFGAVRPSEDDFLKKEARDESGGAKGARHDESQITSEERRWYVLGAMKATLLIALAFIVGLGAAILLMILLWG